MISRWFTAVIVASFCLVSIVSVSAGIDLTEIYEPGPQCDSPDQKTYDWSFQKKDIYRIDGFNFSKDQELLVSTGPAYVGIGHCEPGAVMAVVIPDEPGKAHGDQLDAEKTVEHIWLRFNPKEVTTLFPSDQVTSLGQGNRTDIDLQNLHTSMKRIALFKITSSWQGAGRPFITKLGNYTVDFRTTDDTRYFFAVDLPKNKIFPYKEIGNRTLPESKPLTSRESVEQFNSLWQTFQDHYPGFLIRPEIDWQQVKTEYEPKFAMVSDSGTFAMLAAEMLSLLKDRHIWINQASFHVPVYTPDIKRHENSKAMKKLFGDNLEFTKNHAIWSVSDDRVGYLRVVGWQKEGIVEDIDLALENMRNTRGLVVDVRLNGGGSEPLALDVAGRFLSKAATYSYSKKKTGTGPSDFSDFIPRKISPRGPWQYDRPVIVLIDQPCLSSNESFICMMKQEPTVTTMGYRTGGSSGNPRRETLPCGVTFSIPTWVDYLPDKTPLELKGITPDHLCAYSVEAFQGESDPVLELALDQLAKKPLPPEPIQGPKYTSGDKANVVKVYPTDGSDIQPGETTLKITFDRPMNPDAQRIFFKKGGGVPTGDVVYDSETYTFTVPVYFFPETKISCSVSTKRGQGFKDLEGNPIASFSWSFQVSGPNQTGSENSVKPAVKSIQPDPSQKLGWITVFTVSFDKPMNPYSVIVHSGNGFMGRGGYSLLGSTGYDPETHTFEIPVIMPKNWTGTIELKGFRGADGLLCEDMTIPVTTGDVMFSDEAMKRFLMTSDPDKLDELDKVLFEKRSRYCSFMEYINANVRVSPSIEGYKFISTDQANFAMENNKWFGSMDNMKFGFDNEHYWAIHYSRNPDGTCFSLTPEENDVIAKTLSDPLQLMKDSSRHGDTRPHLEYLGVDSSSGEPCHSFRRWMIERSPRMTQVTFLEFKISAETGLVTEMKQTLNFGLTISWKPKFSQINQDIDDSVFQLSTYSSEEPETENVFGDGVDLNSKNHGLYILNDGSVDSVELRYGFMDDQDRFTCSGSSWR